MLTTRHRRPLHATVLLALAALAAIAGGAPPVGSQATPPPFAELTGSPVAVNGTYQPIVGDFLGPGPGDDILWYAPGSGAESLWRSTGDGGAPFAKASVPAVGGTYRPMVSDFTSDGYDDILWYAPGSAPDSLWDFTPGSLVKRPLTINGTFTPLVLENAPNPDAIFWYAPGSATDWLWTFPVGTSTHASAPYRIDGTYRPIVGDLDDDSLTDIFWYAPGPASDAIWRRTSTDAAGSFASSPAPVGGTYVPLVGDVNQPASTDHATTDIVWTSSTGSDQVWDRSGGTWARTTATIAGPRVLIVDLAGPAAVVSWGSTAPDQVWRGFTAGADRSERTQLANVAADAIPVVGHFGTSGSQQILWYRPGSGAERYWSDIER